MIVYRAIPFLVLFLVACGGSVTKKADTTLVTALQATSAAHDAFVRYDRDAQLSIVEKVTTKEDGEKALAEHRAKREELLRLFTVAYSTIGAAAALVPLVERGEKKDLDLRAALFDVVRATIAIKDAVDQIRAGSR